MKSLICIALGGLSAVAGAAEPAPPLRVEVRSAATLPNSKGPEQTFTGNVQVSAPFQALPPGRAGGATVTFDAQGRTAWHTHPLGQTLIVTAGLGLVQQDGQAAQVIRPGDVVTIPPNVRHWHGAGPVGTMAHVAIAEKLEGSSVAWQTKVSDQEYQAALSSTGLRVPQKDISPVSQTLSAKQQALPLIASFMATSDLPRLNAALNQGLDAGITISEAKEVLVQLYAYAGFPKSLNALSELMKVVAARKQRGIQDQAGTEPSKTVPTGQELIAAGKANQATISGGPVQGPVFDFAPIINQYLQAHLFGDIFERDNLDWQSRELATLGALASMPGVEAQLRSHMLASMRVGLSVPQLRQMIEILSRQSSPDAARRADAALTQALAATSKG
jgi:4-carboxymuconolactone decarboxylase